MKKLGINVGFKVGIGCNFLWIRGHFELFLNCLTIYFILWLRDILGVCRSGYRSVFMNCVVILYNFGVMGMVGV